MLKSALKRVNLILQYRNTKPSLWRSFTKWNYDHNLIKNTLNFANRGLRKINKYHVFRWDLMVGLAGCFFGFVVNEIENLYIAAKLGYKSIASQALVSGILRNKVISKKLRQALAENVFYNTDLQFQVHQLLMHKAILPQKQKIKELITTAIISLNEPQAFEEISKQIAHFVPHLTSLIKTNSLQFLGSDKMDEIAADGLSSVLRSLQFKMMLGENFKEVMIGQMKEKENREYLYQVIREKVI